MTILSAANLHLRSRQQTLCQSLSLRVLPGEMIGILGANGCGKSTLLHTLAGLHTPQSGNVYFNDQPVNTLSAKSLARQRGILFQDTHTALPLSVYEYCLTSRYPHQPFFQHNELADTRLIQSVLQTFELDHLGKITVTQLSGGEKRRLAIAALVIQSPSIYLLDEPSNHLDIRHQISVLEHFKSLAATKKTSVIMTLHDIRLARAYCSRLLLIFPDGFIEEGTPHTMLTNTNLSRLYGCNVSAILY
jgi:iron complex transport system ATP-binding protein